MRKFLVLMLLVLPLAVAGCGKGPAEAALKAADEAIAKVQPEAEKFVPDQFKALQDAAATAKAAFDKGDYSAALTAAKDLPGKANEVMAAAAARKEEMVGQWNALAESMPAVVKGLEDKVAAIEAMKKLPKGFTKDDLTAAWTQVRAVTAQWTQAINAFNAGLLDQALKAGNDAKVQAEELGKLLGPVTVPAPK
jgi:prophage DNA circulation protein